MASTKLIVPLCACAFAGALLSGAVHEIGHAAVAKFAGLEVVRIQPWFLLGRPHVQWHGTIAPEWRAAVNIGGMLASVSVGLLGFLLLQRVIRRDSPLIVTALLLLPMVCQSLAWLVLPLVLMLGGSAPRDDVTAFIKNTRWGHLPVALVGLTLTSFSALVVVRTYRIWRADPQIREPHVNEQSGQHAPQGPGLHRKPK